MDGGIIREISSSVNKLKKEANAEVLYTSDGHRILLEDLVSMNGVRWC